MIFNINSFPPSHSYSEIINNIKPNQIAYCYMGSKKGDIIFRKKENGKLLIFQKEGRNERYEPYELWSFIDEIPNGMIRQNAVNRWYEIFNDYYKYLNLSEYNFKIE